ncbi:hypothetical protein JTB14_031984 [Gonioctena quinquepunctata]|nr:hypothetical protein JTB14_031984 [Gonioctena quinquepunctata]
MHPESEVGNGTNTNISNNDEIRYIEFGDINMERSRYEISTKPLWDTALSCCSAVGFLPIFKNKLKPLQREDITIDNLQVLAIPNNKRYHLFCTTGEFTGTKQRISGY